MPDGWKQIRLEAIPIAKVQALGYLDEHGEEYAKKNGLMFMETSALEGQNIEEAFNSMIAGRNFAMQKL